MTLQASGAISINDIAVELGISNAGLSLNDGRCRNLAGIASGAISLSNFYGKSNYVAPAARTLYPACGISGSGYTAGYSDGTLVPTGAASDNNGSSISNYSFLGQTIKRIFSNGNPTTVFSVSGYIASNSFTSLTLNGVTLYTSNATFSQFAGASYGQVSEWVWATSTGINNSCPTATLPAYTLSFT